MLIGSQRCRACIDEQAALLPGFEDIEEEEGSEHSNDYWPDEIVRHRLHHLRYIVPDMPSLG